MKRGWNRYDVQLDEQEELYIRTGCFLRHPDADLRAIPPKPRRLAFSRLFKQWYHLYKVQGQEFTLSTPYDSARIEELELAGDESLVIKMDHVLAFSTSTFFDSAWRFDLIGLITRQFRYVYLRGPARVIYFGLGDTKEEHIDGTSHDYDRGVVIGWTNTLAHGVSTRSSALSAMLAKEQYCLAHFKGTGTILTQASMMSKLPKRFHDEHANHSLLDFLTAFLGLGLG